MLISLTSVLGKLMELVLLETIIVQMKQAIGKNQHRFTNGELRQISLNTFYNNIGSFVIVGGVHWMLFAWISAKYLTLFPIDFS